jgi:hypothetical protein
MLRPRELPEGRRGGNVRTGSEIEAICGKCGTVWHVVIALAGGKIAQVECKQCHARHRYRSVAGAAAAGATRSAAPRPRAAGSGAPARRTTRKPAKPIVMADPSRPTRPFDTSETYQVGDRVMHASFGEGVVQAVVGAKKIEILFEVGAKTLVHARSAG